VGGTHRQDVFLIALKTATVIAPKPPTALRIIR